MSANFSEESNAKLDIRALAWIGQRWPLWETGIRVLHNGVASGGFRFAVMIELFESETGSFLSGFQN